VYRRDFLLRYAKMAQTPLEKLEKLEQLRALENGLKIAVVDTEYDSIGVDTPEDLEKVRRLVELEARGREVGGREAKGRRSSSL
jgi:3-deoxy-manno-octulosonate cytidylyltransferase (CMP-KDO synthetase)